MDRQQLQKHSSNVRQHSEHWEFKDRNHRTHYNEYWHQWQAGQQEEDWELVVGGGLLGGDLCIFVFFGAAEKGVWKTYINTRAHAVEVLAGICRVVWDGMIYGVA